MSANELIRLAFEEHWILFTFLCPSLSCLYAAVTGQWAWAFSAYLWNYFEVWARRNAIADAVVEKMKKEGR